MTDASGFEEMTRLIRGPARAVVISEREVNFGDAVAENSLFVLLLTEGSLAAGGRGGGFGERRVVRVAYFKYRDNHCEKLFETSDEAATSKFEVPFHVARLPITLPDGTVVMGYGVVDPELVSEYYSRAGSSP